VSNAFKDVANIFRISLRFADVLHCGQDLFLGSFNQRSIQLKVYKI